MPYAQDKDAERLQPTGILPLKAFRKLCGLMKKLAVLCPDIGCKELSEVCRIVWQNTMFRRAGIMLHE